MKFKYIALIILATITLIIWNPFSATNKNKDTVINNQINPEEKLINNEKISKININIDDNGFSPSSLKINKGDIVAFTNIGKNAHWPASNNHPSHEIYPEFDPKKPISPGSSWEFQFNKSGSWKMHDHLSPRFSGVIIVN